MGELGFLANEELGEKLGVFEIEVNWPNETQNGQLEWNRVCLNGEKWSWIRIGKDPILDSQTMVHLEDQNCNSATPIDVRLIGNEIRYIMP